MNGCACNGDPRHDPCPWCERRIDRAEHAMTDPDPDGWMQAQDRYERRLEEPGP